MSAGFQVHVTKPVEPPELLAVVAGLAGRARHVPSAVVIEPPSIGRRAMTPDLGTTNLWLAMLAIASAGQFLMLVGAAVLICSASTSRASANIDALEHEQIRPIAAAGQRA